MNKSKLFQRKLFSIKMRSMIYLEQITKGKIKQFTKLNYSNKKEWEIKFAKFVHYEFHTSSINHDFLTFIRKDSKKLVVFFNGAVNTEKQCFPVFQRWSWLRYSPYSSIIFSDPTLNPLAKNKSRNSIIGWYQGNEENFALTQIVEIVKNISIKLSINTSDILFYGSSAGGFAALYASFLLKGSRACVVNPQIIILNFDKQYVNKILAHLNIHPAHNILSTNSICKFVFRLDIIKLYSSDVENIPLVIYYKQNIFDTHHYQKHYIPFLKMMKKKQKTHNMHTILFSNNQGHGAIPLFEEGLVDISNTFNLPIRNK